MGRYRSLQSIMLAEALKGITDNQTITAYKKDCKLFAAYCKEQGVKRPDQLQGKEKELLQGYEKQLEASGYSPATIHRRLYCLSGWFWIGFCEGINPCVYLKAYTNIGQSTF